MIPFSTNEEACKAIAAIYVDGITPSGMEFLKRSCRKTFDYCDKVLNSPVTTKLIDGMNAYLLCELDGNDEEVLMRDAERVMGVVEKFESGEILFADTDAQKAELWKIRKNISPAVNWYTLTKSDDVVCHVPIYQNLSMASKKLASDIISTRFALVTWGWQLACQYFKRRTE